MFLALEERLRTAVAAHIKQRYNVDIPVVIELPRQQEFGELATPVSFALAKELKQAPRQIAMELVGKLTDIPGIASIELAGGGFLNVRLERGAYAQSLRAGESYAADRTPKKIIIEHTNINPNKAAHIGHLRNAVLGDTLVRMMRALGENVEAQNYIDNTGVQVADVVAAFHHLEKMTAAKVVELVDNPDVRFDYYCWDLYARISQHYQNEPDALAWRAETLHAIEADQGDLAEIGRIVAGAVVHCHMDTMYRLNVEYDLLPRESEILHMQFWSAAFEMLKERKAIYLEDKGKLKGCWVMPSDLFQETKQKDAEEEEESKFEESKVIVRSNGTVTYVGKDIAYTLWKFGLLEGRDFHYKQFRSYPSGRVAWYSVPDASDPQTPRFGKGDAVFNVIDTRQSYLQDVVKAGLQCLGFKKVAENFVHFSYEMVALTPRCCAELGIELSEEDRRRPYVEVSGRKGLGVKADDLLDMLIASALQEVSSRHEQLPYDERKKIATQIAVGALRYFMLRFTRTTVIAFDFQEALSFEGETGPYVQYATVRARNILRKFEATGESMPDFDAELTPAVLASQLENEDFWQLMLSASRLHWVVQRSINAAEPAQLARYAFQVAQTFNNFYHQHHILKEEDPERKVFLLWMTQFFLKELTAVLDVMGIEAPRVM
ncbi:MAG: arginine--tRNA ligase [Acidobacteria bacterium]|nr:arginine--tRNA ligase [Acidobacteriota bacterium]MDA1234801.1 arginine--tRNA ligase [Acidobacteriota bacterium]